MNMSASFDIENRTNDSAGFASRRLVRYAIGSFAALLLLIAYCELCSVVRGLPAPGLKISGAWALQLWVPWLVIGTAFGIFGQRIVDLRIAHSHPRAVMAIVIASVATFAASAEALLAKLLRDETSLLWFVYERAPAHLAASALLVAVYLGQRFWRSRKVPPSEAMEVMTGTGRTHIAFDEIEYLQADRNYINVIHVSGRTYLLRQTMAATQRTLDEARFMRVHRSTIVNRQLIKEHRPGGVLVLQSGRTVTVSRAYRSQLRH
jgi:DNA-binding LytR/AlgR family response regulator